MFKMLAIQALFHVFIHLSIFAWFGEFFYSFNERSIRVQWLSNCLHVNVCIPYVLNE